MASTRNRGREARQFRAEMKAIWQAINQACAECGQATIDWDGPANAPDSFELDHRHPIATHPELEFDPTNVRPTHSRCNRSKGAGKMHAGIGTTSEAW